MNISHFFRRDDDSRPAMILPHIKDTDDFRQEAKVKALCRKCAEQLAAYLFRWEKKWPSQSTVKTWDEKDKSFRGMDLSLFSAFIMNHFSVRTPDNREWLLDRRIASLIWAACTADDSPLPEASWEIEMERKKGGKHERT